MTKKKKTTKNTLIFEALIVILLIGWCFMLACAVNEVNEDRELILSQSQEIDGLKDYIAHEQPQVIVKDDCADTLNHQWKMDHVKK